MKIEKVVVDHIPKDCIACPLSNQYRKDCGKECSVNYNSGLRIDKLPDERCKLKKR